ncbi:Disease resistance protein [Macleaya cordata]|uniref:Disease resistance protein n=1 Tax=Macleaya cordata TaxID=56857 RepID=A0A200QY03_MACCD|nr:Disease resistance protein [Macleaya cordata]
MTEAVVGFLVEQLLASLKEEANVILGFQSQFEKMRKNLTPMKSFLIDLQHLKTRNNNDYEIVKSSLATLRDLIYDADDILLDCQLQADYQREASTIPCIFSPRELLFRYRIGKRLKEINMQISEMENILKTYCAPFLLIQKISQDESNSINTRWTTHIFNQSEIVGLTENTRQIKRWILQKNEDLQRVGIVGMGGLGKTTLAQKIFNDKEVRVRFDDRIWVSVSQPVNIVNIMKSMLQQLGQDDNGTEGTLLENVKKTLTNKTYLIVMDDVWNTENGWWTNLFNALRKEGKYNNSSIIITTRNEEVARNMGVREGRIHRPKLLNKEDSWSLFCNVAFSAAKGVCRDPKLENVGKKIVENCDGLPLVIKAIGGLLSTKTQSISKWEKIHDDFRDKLAENVNDSSIIASLQLSYDALPARLKQCILCFSIYPEDFLIKTEQLVHWWVGEGFVQANERKTATELAFDCLSELFNRCLVEVVEPRGYDGRVYECRMHDMVRELIIRMAKEEAFCSFDDGNRQKFDPDSRHLGFTHKEMSRQPLQTNSKLRAFLMFLSLPFSFSPYTSGLAKVNSLRMLDISQEMLAEAVREGVYIEDLLGWIRSQKRLASLKLWGIVGLKELPHWIRELRNLQHLLLRYCDDLEKLSPYITTLQKLIVLDLRWCRRLEYLPKGLEKLFNLEELSGFKLVSPGTDGCRLGDLKSLPKLRVLRLETGRDIIAKDELEVLSQFHLQVLNIDSEGAHDMTMVQLDELSPPQSLQELTLSGYERDVLPYWVNPFSLPHLQYLGIGLSRINIGPNFWGSEEIQWKIEGLSLTYLPFFQVEWKTVEKMMPSIKHVVVNECPLLQSFPYDETIQGDRIWRKKDEEDEERKYEIKDSP